MQRKTDELVKLAAKSELRVSKPKTKVIPINPINDLQPITIGDKELEDVNRFSYLGYQIDSEESSTTDINSCIGKAQSAFNKLRWTRLDIESVQQKDKTKVLQKQCVIYFDVWSRVLENQQKGWKQDQWISGEECSFNFLLSLSRLIWFKIHYFLLIVV